ncbi:hypothetical protein L596_005799 [Steinernema carpocapsae]|uniref:Uncharacterized protein n=1 Tax=Steinernema carpocapsae TaxID=34508 RepID=A0A4U8V1E9_STECR|nr:hypothetical protein L596_005799 [Steinernema carpocapsae]
MRKFKVVVLGSSGVGKTCLINNLVRGTFYEHYDPTLEDKYTKEIAIDGKTCLLQIVDTSGVEQFEAQRDRYIRNAEGFVLVYSVADRSSLYSTLQIYNRIVAIRGSNNIPVILVGTKCDVITNREVFAHEGQSVATELTCSFAEASAKLGKNVYDIFEDIVQQIRYVQEVANAPIQEEPEQNHVVSSGHGTEQLLLFHVDLRNNAEHDL